MKLFVPISFAILLIACTSSIKTNTPSTAKNIPVESINLYIDTLLTDTLINALSIGIHYQGEKFINHYGALDRGKDNTPTDKTIYDIASVTKTFVGTLIAQAELEGKLSLEDDIRKFLGNDYENLAFENQPIRIKHLLTHTSELPRFLPESINDLFTNIDDGLPFRIVKIQNAYSKDLFLKDVQNLTIDTFPGSRYRYSNADTELAAYLLELIYQKSFDELLEEKICTVAKLSNTSIRLNEEQSKHHATGYGPNNKPTPRGSTKLWGASGEGKSTLPDLMNYIAFQLDKNNTPVQKTHQVLYDKEVIYGDPGNTIGYFWVLNNDEDLGKYVSHHGGGFGVQNWMFLYPEVDLGITVVTNQGDWRTAGKLMYIVNGVLEEMKKVHKKD